MGSKEREELRVEREKEQTRNDHYYSYYFFDARFAIKKNPSQ
jgi:hypothetical protein